MSHYFPLTLNSSSRNMTFSTGVSAHFHFGLHETVPAAKEAPQEAIISGEKCKAHTWGAIPVFAFFIFFCFCFREMIAWCDVPDIYFPRALFSEYVWLITAVADFLFVDVGGGKKIIARKMRLNELLR